MSPQSVTSASVGSTWGRRGVALWGRSVVNLRSTSRAFPTLFFRCLLLGRGSSVGTLLSRAWPRAHSVHGGGPGHREPLEVRNGGLACVFAPPPPSAPPHDASRRGAEVAAAASPRAVEERKQKRKKQRATKHELTSECHHLAGELHNPTLRKQHRCGRRHRRRQRRMPERSRCRRAKDFSALGQK